MKKIFFGVLVMVYSMSYAGWEFTINTADGDFADYHDKSTIKKKGVITKMWIMRDFSRTQYLSDDKAYNSLKMMFAFDCKEEKLTGISIAVYSGSKGEGDVVSVHTVKENEWQWNSIVPGSVDAANWKVACGKK